MAPIQFRWDRIGLKEALVVIVGIGAIGGVMAFLSPTPHASLGQTTASPTVAAQNPFDLRDVTAEMSWAKGGFDTVMLADLTITNRSKQDVKDLEVRCDLFGNSGTRIDSTTRTLYEIVPAGAKKTFRKVNMGFIRTQAASASCEITDLKVVR